MSAIPRGRRTSRVLAIVVALHLVAALGVWISLSLWGDSHWPVTLLLFGPRWIYAVPFLVTVPAAILLDRRLLAFVAATALVIVGPIMDFRVPFRSPFASAVSPSRLRVLTYNIGGGRMSGEALEGLIDEIAPDIAAFQECNTQIDPAKLAAKGWHVRAKGGQCLLSRYPIKGVDARDRRDVWAMNGSGTVVRYDIETPAGVVNFVNVHLETVRDGLSALMAQRLGGVPELQANIGQRALESKIARAWVERGGRTPTIVAGDFNMPVESAIYDQYWSDYRNAFSEAGFGFGVSKATRWHGIRIDHVLVDPTWICKRAWVARDLGLDHRPVVAEIERASTSL
jgi:vancomycin resistance protein VanJ